MVTGQLIVAGGSTDDRDMVVSMDTIRVIVFESQRTEENRLVKLMGQFKMPFDQQTYEQMERYRASLRGYRKNAYKLDRKTRRELARRWGFAIRRWNYEPPNV